MKTCGRCGHDKPLTIEHWLPRKESKDGFRGTCRLCWYAQQRPNKRRYYANHSAEILAERKATRPTKPAIDRAERHRENTKRDYERNREKRQAADRAYYARNKESINERVRQRRAANPTPFRQRDLMRTIDGKRKQSHRAYYWRHREQQLAQNRLRYQQRYRPGNSLNNGWTKAWTHDRIELKLWKDRMYAELCRREACEFIETLERRLSPQERTLLDCLVDANFDEQMAAEMAGVTMPMFNETLTAIRQVAVKIRSTEWTQGFFT